MVSVIKEIEKRTNEHPDKLLFAFLDISGAIKESYTYRSFEQRTKDIAAYIHSSYGLVQGDRILLAYAPGLEMICAFFACVRLGLIPVPVYPPSARGLEASVQKMNFIAQDSGAKAVITDRSCYWSYKVNLSRHKSAVSDLLWIVSDDAPTGSSIILSQALNDTLFLQYTSGSTSDPKGVMVTHANVIANGNNVVDHLPIGVSWLPQYHDMGLIGYYLFFAVRGGTTYGFAPADFIQRPALWLETITRYKATASSAPNFAYEYCLLPGKIPDSTLASLDLGSLRFLMTAAEPIRPAVYKAFVEKFKAFSLDPKSFFGAYGLAEFTLAVTNYGRTSLAADAALLKKKQVRIADPADADTTTVALMSCGRALHDTVIKIVDTEDGNREAAEGHSGEIWLSGSSKCSGYWGRPQLSKEIFEAEIAGGTRADKWLRTGDIGFLHKGELYVCGRMKDLIILRGLNYYPQDIEAIVEEDPLVRSGCVVAFAVEREGKETLVIIAGTKSAGRLPDARAIHDKVNQYLGISVSEIVFVPARTISKTSSGKLRRYENRERYLNDQLQAISRVMLAGADADDNREVEGSCDIPDHHSLLSRYKLTGEESTVLGDAGLDSLKMAEFVHDLQTLLEKKGLGDLSQEVDMKLLQRIAVSELFAMLRELDTASRFARFRFRKAFAAIRSAYERSETDLMRRDAVLPHQPAPANDLPPQNATGNDILLTGGTGFFGPFILCSLLEQNTCNIYVLVRAASAAEGMRRLRSAFDAIHPSAGSLAAFGERVRPVCGDLALPGLGLSTGDRGQLVDAISTIYHNGAYVNYLMDYSAMRQINVAGTKEVIAFAMERRPKVLNYISTTFIFGWSAREVLYERDHNRTMEYLDFGYSQSKWVSDQLVLAAMEQGLQARIFRPALISPSVSGGGYNFDISMRLLSFMLKYGIGTAAHNQVSFTPADVAANNIVAIAGLEASIGKTFHVTRDEYATMHDVTTILGKLAGRSFQSFELKEFVPEVVSRCTKQDLLFPLLGFLVRSVDNISAMEFKRYDNSNYRKFRSLTAWGREDPPLEEVVNGMYLFMKSNTETAGSLNTAEIPT